MKIFNSAQIAEIDRYTLEAQHLKEYDLVTRVGKRLAQWMRGNLVLKRSKVVIFAGTGNNGNDAIALAKILGGWDIDCQLYVIGSKSKNSSLRRQLIEELYIFSTVRWKELCEGDEIPPLPNICYIVDGIFGTGLNRSVEGFYCKLIEKINSSGAKVISIDVPSGLLSDHRNEDESASVVRAHHTLTIQFPKLCMFFKENYQYTGDWEVIDVDLDLDIIDTIETPYSMIEKNSVRSILKKRGKYSHKGDYGHGLLIAGSAGMAGSAILAARGALRAGLGLLTLHVPKRLHDILQVSVPEAICETDRSDSIFTGINPRIAEKFDAVAVGPGIGKSPDTVAALKDIINSCNRPMVIDADAINILSTNKEMLELIPQNSVITPHPREFARIAGKYRDSREAAEMQMEFSAKNNITVVLKGANTSVSTPDGKMWFNSTGNPGMATAGSGDVLGGIILGFLSQGYSAREAAIAGTYLHGLSGDIVAAIKGEASLIAGDIADNLGEAFKRVLG